MQTVQDSRTVLADATAAGAAGINRVAREARAEAPHETT